REWRRDGLARGDRRGVLLRRGAARVSARRRHGPRRALPHDDPFLHPRFLLRPALRAARDICAAGSRPPRTAQRRGLVRPHYAARYPALIRRSGGLLPGRNRCPFTMSLLARRSAMAREVCFCGWEGETVDR